MFESNLKCKISDDVEAFFLLELANIGDDLEHGEQGEERRVGFGGLGDDESARAEARVVRPPLRQRRARERERGAARGGQALPVRGVALLRLPLRGSKPA